MKRIRMAAVALTLMLAFAAVPAHSAADGCVAVGTHSVHPMGANPWDCFYTASGPGNFVADTPNPFVIAVSHDSGASWVDLVRRPRAGAPTEGILVTEPGDLVSVSISCFDPITPSCESGLGGRDGMIWAQSQV